MKLNRGLLLASALLVGSLAVTGCSTQSSDEGTDEQATAIEQVAQKDGAETVASNDQGTVEYARFGGHFGGRGHGVAFRGGHGGRGRGFRGEHGRFGHARRPWWRIW